MILGKHRIVFLTPLKESATHRSNRLSAAKTQQELRSDRYSNRKGYPKRVLELINAFRELGLNYLDYPSLRQVQKKLEGCSMERFSPAALLFLSENFPVQQVEDRRGIRYLHFKSKGEQTMSLLTRVAELSEAPRKTVKAVYEALVSTVHEELKSNRRVRLPEIGVVKLSFKEARKAGKRPNPFKPGEMMQVSARKASNKLTIRPVKPLKDYAAKLPVKRK